MKNVLAIVGSNSSKSVNKQLVQYAATLFTDADVKVIDMNDVEVHLFSEDRERESGYPEKITDLIAQIAAADGVIFSSPEHNGMPPAALKNTIDWMSRAEKNFMGQRPLLMMSTSPGGKGGQNNLDRISHSIKYWGGDVKASFSLGGFYDKFADGALKNEEDVAALTEAVRALEAAM